MKLEDVAVVLRPRTPWEAVDLGTAMYRAWWRPVLLAWLFSVVPAILVLFALLDSFWLVLLALFLLEPLFERVPLFVVSRILFGARPDLAEFFRSLPGLWGRDLFGALVRHRLHVCRGMIAPVSVLEGLRGRERAQRERILSGRVSGVSLALGTCARCMQLGLFVACFVLVFLLLPAEQLPDFELIREGELSPAASSWLSAFSHVALLVVYSAIGPLAATCGFALYLNRRSLLEGWDIEVTFRRLDARMQRDAASAWTRVGGFLLAACLGCGAAQAGQGGDRQPGEVVQEVLAHEDFETREVRTEWKLPWEFEGGSGGGSDFGLAVLFEFLMWTAAAVGLVYALYHLCKTLGWIEVRRTEKVEPSAPPEQLFGLDLRPESLPDDVPSEALALWRAGHAVEALALLYRASIARLIERQQVDFKSSDTERDCLRRVRLLGASPRCDAFADVTRAWQNCAYSSSRPRDEEVERLCASWSEHFDGRTR